MKDTFHDDLIDELTYGMCINYAFTICDLNFFVLILSIIYRCFKCVQYYGDAL